MPQIANQDYIIAEAKSTTRLYSQDAACLSTLAGAIKKGTIFDCLISGLIATGPDRIGYRRVVSFDKGKKAIQVGESSWVQILYSQENYSALAIVQSAEDSIKGSDIAGLPAFGSTSGILFTSDTGAQAILSTEDGYVYKVEAEGPYTPSGKIVSVKKSTTTIEAAKTALSLDNVIVLSEEDAANLAGYRVTPTDA